ncbi:hypothetical protein TCAL_07409, partial [Tigriopus californicus]
RHPYGTCPGSKNTCHGCGRSGHFRLTCTNKQQNTGSKLCDQVVVKTNTVRVCMTQNDVGRSTPLAKVLFHLHGGSKVEMAVLPDTGATDSIVSDILMRRNGIVIDKTRTCRIIAANGSQMRYTGAVEFGAEWAGFVADVTAYVSPDTRDFILSWHDMITLGMIPETFTFDTLNQDPDLSSIEKWKNAIIFEYVDVFDSPSSFKPMSGPGRRKTHPFYNHKTCFHAYRDEAKKELDYMDALCVVVDADEPSEWVSPFLALPKPNGQGVRLVVEFRGIQNIKKVVDDILCYSETFQELVNIVLKVIERCRKHHPAHQYCKEWDRLSVEATGLLLLDSSRILIPSMAQRIMLDCQHLAHQRITRTKAQARRTVYWHCLMNEIVQMVNSCEKCQMYLSSQAKEPLVTTGQTNFPFQSSSTDLFEFGGAQFLVHVDSKKHHAANALSCFPLLDIQEEDQDGPVLSGFDSIHLATASVSEIAKGDVSYQAIISTFISGQSPKSLPWSHLSKLHLKQLKALSLDYDTDLLILQGHRIVVTTVARPTILQDLHIAHQGIRRTRALARSLYFWPGMNNEIKQIISSCATCQEHRPSQPA